MPVPRATGLAFFCTNVGRAVHSVSKAATSALRAVSTDPTNHKATMYDDPVGWGEVERKEIANHLLNETMTPWTRATFHAGAAPSG